MARRMQLIVATTKSRCASVMGGVIEKADSHPT
jgi:hypothetical protein